jgi:hypothetical protein
LSFRNTEEATAAICEVESNYSQHALAARAIAEEYSDSDKVLARLIGEAMSSDENTNDHGRPQWGRAKSTASSKSTRCLSW